MVEANGLTDKITIYNERIQLVDIPEKVDIIISEPIGFFLVHERMLEVYVIARDRFLKPDGMMFPSSGEMIFAPWTDATMYNEQVSKSSFWNNADFYGVNISGAVEIAKQEYLSQPVVGAFSTSNLISSQRAVHCVDFLTVTTEELQNFEIEFRFRIDQTALMHGFGCWFDINFEGTQSNVVLTTSPDNPTTHWYQCRLFLLEPLAVNKGQFVYGSMKFIANEKFSYYIMLTATIEGTDITSTNKINLHDQVCYV